MKIRVAFYKGEGDWKNKIIRWWTKSPYSHAELILPDGITWISISPLLSSKVESRSKIKYIDSNWDFVDIAVTQQQNDVIKEFYESTKGCGYDWIGMLMSQFLPFNIKRKGRWYCSEWIAYALRISCVIDWRLIKIYDRADLSPSMLYKIIRSSESEI
ncbi:MAG TPA: hypothetical protein DEG69_13500 [Flavobacteriaceae bacterium]|nr:hypothetical protein [Flavobacteriaceae bacterium]